MTDQQRIAELEHALRLHLAVSPDDPLLVEPVEQEVVRLRTKLARLKDMQQGPGTPITRFHALLEELETRFPDPAPYDSSRAPEQHYVHAIDQLRAEVARLTEDREIGLQLTGSFFEALKPLKLPAINVQNPGCHVTDVIAQLAARTKERDRHFDLLQAYRLDLAKVRQQLAAAKARVTELEATLRYLVDRHTQSLTHSTTMDWSHAIALVATLAEPKEETP